MEPILRLPAVSLFCLLVLASAGADQCLKGAALKDSQRVTLSNCEKPPCLLKKKTSTNVELKFTPKEDIAKLTNVVSADILGVPFPFVGVDGANVCDKIYDGKTGEKVDCPLKAGVDYVYKDEFKILEVYPKIKVQVHWALRSEKGQDAICFEIPAKIIS